MATTEPRTWDGVPTIDVHKAVQINERYRLALGDADKSTAYAESEYYSGRAEAFAEVMDLLFGQQQ